LDFIEVLGDHSSDYIEDVEHNLAS